MLTIVVTGIMFSVPIFLFTYSAIPFLETFFETEGKFSDFAHSPELKNLLSKCW